MTWAPRRLKDGRELWPCPFCAAIGRTDPSAELAAALGFLAEQSGDALQPEELPGPVELYVCADGEWWCMRCGQHGTNPRHLRGLIDQQHRNRWPNPSPALQVATGLHWGNHRDRGFRAMGRELLKRCAGDVGLAPDLLHSWALLHVWPPPSFAECEVVLDSLTTRHLKAVK